MNRFAYTVFCRSQIVLAAVLVAVLVSSCSIIQKGSYREPVYFDIGNPVEMGKGANGVSVQMRRFEYQGPGGGPQMAFRTADKTFKFDDYHRWAQPPEEMIARYFSLHFNTTPNAPVTIDAVVYELFADLAEQKAYLVMQVTVDDNSLKGKTQTLMVRKVVPIDGEVTAAAFAKATTKAVVETAKDIAAKLK